MKQPADARQREAALNPEGSFLVQAPAGSGKTELLIQRFLQLLAKARAPEEILAVTFTRKAAAEMRARILEALERAALGSEPDAPHLRLGFRLAGQAIERDREQGWQLLEQPSRLRIGTIDSVNAWLSGRAPFSAGSASLLEVTEDPAPLYEQAARDTVALAAETGELGEAMRTLLGHFDNRAELLVGVISLMLGRRDQWLRHTGAGPDRDALGLRAALENALASLVAHQLARSLAALPEGLRPEILELMRFAAESLADAEPRPEVLAWRNRDAFPTASASELPCWRSLAGTLLTKSGSWRKQVDKRVGFPPGATGMKSRCKALLETLGANEKLGAELAIVQTLPDPLYTDAQWSALRALLVLLPVSAAQLQQCFAEQGAVDFNQVARDALTSLGDEDAPTELTLAMDYAVRHILLDEFQDTSRTQYDLLRRLTSGWASGDGHSLFLVGDPMQSIYRFREADVSVYLDTQRRGLGSLQLDFLQLESNFRADPQLVNWVNRHFARILPTTADEAVGAVPFRPSQAEQPSDPTAGVYWESFGPDERDAEMDRVVDIVRDCSARWPEQSIGILVRSRSHAWSLAPRLRAAGIRFAAADLESLREEPPVQDLLALTRALLHPADRIAWLAVLRAPWCGLSLADLHALASPDHEANIWSILESPDALARLSEDGARRAIDLRETLRPWLTRRGGCPLAELVEGCWLWLGGPATLEQAEDLELAGAFFEFLEQEDQGGDCADIAQLDQRLARHSVTVGPQDARVQIMTMHKAKGLEFDTVLLPGLGMSTRKDTKPPLLWRELVSDGDPPPLVLAPVNPTGEAPDPIYELLWSFERERARLEQDRLLYVAVTRARRRLWLFAQLGQSSDGARTVRKDSLLGALWPVCRDEIPAAASDSPGSVTDSRDGNEPQWLVPVIRRFSASWQRPEFIRAHPPAWQRQAAASEAVEFDWAQRWTMHVGTVVHRWLQEIADQGLASFDAQRIQALQPQFRRQLLHLGTAPDSVERAVDRVCRALQATLADPQGRWLLAAEHRDASTELAVTRVDAAGLRQLRVDRSFVTVADERWIVDYKTGSHEGKDLSAFIASESDRYRSQLLAYRNALAGLDQRRLRTALYFPLLSVLAEVEFEPGALE